jgi:membrane associated rhomboid family serine protease
MLVRVLAATVAGGLIFYVLGFVLFGIILDPVMKNYMNEFPGLMKTPMPDLVFLPLWNLAMAFLFAIVFEKWASIRTFVGGLKGGFLLMLIVTFIIDFNYLAFMNLFKGPIGVIIEIAASTALGTLAAGVVGAVLGLMNKSSSAN